MTKKDLNDDLKSPDLFISTADKLGHWMQKNKEVIYLVVGTVVVLSVGYLGYSQWHEHHEMSAQKELYSVESKVNKITEELRNPKTDKDTDSTTNSKQKTIDEVYGQTLADYNSKIKDLLGTKASYIGSIDLASIYMDFSKFEEAKEILNTAFNSAKGDGFFEGLIGIQLGTVQLELKNSDEAKKHFQSILDNEKLQYLHPEAMLKLGITEFSFGDKTKGKELLTRVSQEFSASESGKSAKILLRNIELQGN